MIMSLLLLPTAGSLMLVGGGSTTPEMVTKFAELCGGKSYKIFVLPQTREDVTKGNSSAELLRENGFTNVTVILDDKPSEERLLELEKTLASAKGLWIPGGDQNRFMERFGVKWSQRVFPALVASGVNWFGTSAGAMVASNPMIGGNEAEGTAKIVPGIGLFDALIDTHFRARNREPRLKRAYLQNKHQWGFGLDEGEWVILRGEEIIEKHGEPRVMTRE
jgi:cyanophycinase